MKFTPEVIAALKTLKSAAENDFERHRLDVLEKDLTAPPKVEIIDEKHQKFLGVTYHEEKSGTYRQVVGIHQAVYEYYYGEIPKDHHIHHVDWHKSNNSIDNLQMLTKTEHLKIHRPKGYEMATHQKKTFICEVCGKEYEAHCSGKNRFCSPEYRNKQFTKICEWCGKTFITGTKESKCCSISCAQRLLHKDHREIRTCVICGKTFSAPKSKAQKTCSTECRFKSMAKTKRENYSEERTCPVCGKKFTVPRCDDTKTCSPECGHALTALTRKAHSWGIEDIDFFKAHSTQVE